MKENDIDDILNKLINHKIEINFTQHYTSTLRSTSGILKQVTPDTIHMLLYNTYGEPEQYYLNRRSCVLLSIIDEGAPQK